MVYGDILVRDNRMTSCALAGKPQRMVVFSTPGLFVSNARNYISSASFILPWSEYKIPRLLNVQHSTVTTIFASCYEGTASYAAMMRENEDGWLIDEQWVSTSVCLTKLMRESNGDMFATCLNRIFDNSLRCAVYAVIDMYKDWQKSSLYHSIQKFIWWMTSFDNIFIKGLGRKSPCFVVYTSFWFFNANFVAKNSPFFEIKVLICDAESLAIYAMNRL